MDDIAASLKQITFSMLRQWGAITCGGGARRPDYAHSHEGYAYQQSRFVFPHLALSVNHAETTSATWKFCREKRTMITMINSTLSCRQILNLGTAIGRTHGLVAVVKAARLSKVAISALALIIGGLSLEGCASDRGASSPPAHKEIHRDVDRTNAPLVAAVTPDKVKAALPELETLVKASLKKTGRAWHRDRGDLQGPGRLCQGLWRT